MRNNNILNISRGLGMKQNVSFRVIDTTTGKVVQEHIGHNAVTNSMLWGIGQFLTGTLSESETYTVPIQNNVSYYSVLSNYIPRYISLGTMGLLSQNEDANHLPTGVGDERIEGEEARFEQYMQRRPGYGADGYDEYTNNDRAYLGLGWPYTSYDASKRYVIGDEVMYQGRLYRCTAETTGTFNTSAWTDDGVNQPSDKSHVRLELISPSFPRVEISYRDIVPEYESEAPKTIDVVFSALISTGALAQFRQEGKDYIFITEAGLWSKRNWEDSGQNGLLAGYRIGPTNPKYWLMSTDAVQEYAAQHNNKLPNGETATAAKCAAYAASNRLKLKQSILRVGRNQVVQVIWKIQLGSIEQFADVESIRNQYYDFN